jgi:hypothetical protein
MRIAKTKKHSLGKNIQEYNKVQQRSIAHSNKEKKNTQNSQIIKIKNKKILKLENVNSLAKS